MTKNKENPQNPYGRPLPSNSSNPCANLISIWNTDLTAAADRTD
jgi:hypothetical protein